MTEALVLERSLDEWPLDDFPTHVHAHQLWLSGDVDAARPVFAECRRAGVARHEPHAEGDALWYLSLLEWRAANWEESDHLAARSLELDARLGPVLPTNEYPAAIIAAHRGRVDDARAVAERAFAAAEAVGMTIAQAGHGCVLGFIELSLGNAAAALPHLRGAVETVRGSCSSPGCAPSSAMRSKRWSRWASSRRQTR